MNCSIMLVVKIRVKQQKKVVTFMHRLGSASAQVKFEFDSVSCVVDVVGCVGNMCIKMILNECEMTDWCFERKNKCFLFKIFVGLVGVL